MMSVVAIDSNVKNNKRSDSTMVSSKPLQVLTGNSSILDYFQGMMECGGPMDSDAGDIEADKILHSQRHQRDSMQLKKNKKKERSPKNRNEVSKSHEYLHVDDMTDDEIAQSWYTNDDIQKFRKQKKGERRMRKRRIQIQQEHLDISEYSDGESVYSADSDSMKKAVRWGNKDDGSLRSKNGGSESDASSDRESISSTRLAAKPVLKNSQSDDKTLLANGMAYRRSKTTERTLVDQRRIAAMHKAFYKSGILFRGDQNRMERFFHLSDQFNDEYNDENNNDCPKEKEEAKQEEAQEKEQTSVVVQQDLIESKEESRTDPPTTEGEPEVIILLEASIGVMNDKKDDPIDHQSEKHTEGEEKTEILFPLRAFPDTMLSTSTKDDVQPTVAPTSPIMNMDLVLSMQPNQHTEQQQQEKQNYISSANDSFSFPSYPANYEVPSKDQQNYIEYRMENVLEERQRSPELVDLATAYQTFRRRLLNVVKSVKTYQKAIAQMEQARSACLEECSNLIQEPPTGKVRPGTFQFAVEKSPITKLKEFGEMEQVNRTKEFQEHVLDYATRWENAVTQKVDNDIKQVKKLQQSRLHYEKKVESLRKKVNVLDTKGKGVPADLVERLERNESKLKDAWELHEWNASRLCALIEQVVEYGWKDLVPLVSNLFKYEFNRSGGELVMYGKFPLLMDSFEQPFRRFETDHILS